MIRGWCLSVWMQSRSSRGRTLTRRDAKGYYYTVRRPARLPCYAASLVNLIRFTVGGKAGLLNSSSADPVTDRAVEGKFEDRRSDTGCPFCSHGTLEFDQLGKRRRHATGRCWELSACLRQCHSHSQPTVYCKRAMPCGGGTFSRVGLARIETRPS